MTLLDPSPNQNQKHIHIIGIAGSAMAPLAGMLRERGFRVTGSDSGVYPPASTLLVSLGIAYFSSFDAAHLSPPPALAVVGNIIARGNPELEEVLERKIPYRSMPEVLEEVFLPGKHSVVVSGTHGKTTTTAMLAWIFASAGKQPTFLAGGEAMAEFLAANARPNDLLLIMSNGSFDGLCEKLLSKLSAAERVPAGADSR